MGVREQINRARMWLAYAIMRLRTTRVSTAEELREAVDKRRWRTILIEVGTYPIDQPLVIKKPLILKGEQREYTTIVGGDRANPMIEVDARFVTIRDLTFKYVGRMPE